MNKSITGLNAMFSGVAGTAHSPLVSLLQQLEVWQWLPADVITERQYKMLRRLTTHAQMQSPYFRERLLKAALQPDDLASPQGLRRLPVMSRRDLQSAGDALFCGVLPPAHMPVTEYKTSGSSGEPVLVKRTAVNKMHWLANTLREHLWHQRDFLGTLAIIRAFLPPGRHTMPDWGAPASSLFKTGQAFAMSISTDVRQQVDWLIEINPDYLLTYPTNLAALLRELQQRKVVLPNIRQLRTISETVPDELRILADQVLGVGITDTYSSQEVGVIALQCPASGLYHIMSECLIVEVLDESGEPCQPGQIGRVVITDLHNLATPLVRYDIRDYAEVGSACPCGRGLPTLKRILGRSRNMVQLPDGSSHWPITGFPKYREIAPIRQFQFIQRSLKKVEVRLVCESALNTEQESRLAEVIHASLGFPFQLQFVYFPDEIPGSRGGKFEEFICEVARPMP